MLRDKNTHLYLTMLDMPPLVTAVQCMLDDTLDP